MCSSTLPSASPSMPADLPAAVDITESFKIRLGVDASPNTSSRHVSFGADEVCSYDVSPRLCDDDAYTQSFGPSLPCASQSATTPALVFPPHGEEGARGHAEHGHRLE
mmetsp:Transcript_2748/g.9268  ORF Transcript_2748/g.9268 Transcript_2748/m.9268 type:complete len:108 (+) Transcript_2748:429-752(+)